MQAFAAYIVAREKEPSTWAGFAPILIAAGVPAGTMPVVTQIGIALAGAIAMLVPESK
jgi:hypothetical protein